MSEQQTYVGKLVQHHKTGDEDLLTWQYTGTTRFELPVDQIEEGSRALVDNELIYVYRAGKWEFNAPETYTLSMLQQEETNVELITGSPNPVEGIDFSSKPRNEWTMGNWIAHVGGSIRSDHFVVFGSVMAVDMMVRQIIRNVLGMKKEGVNISLSGGTEKQRLMLATAITGALEPITVNPGYNLKKFVDSQAENMLSFEQTVVIMDAIEASGGINLEVVADKAEQ